MRVLFLENPEEHPNRGFSREKVIYLMTKKIIDGGALVETFKDAAERLRQESYDIIIIHESGGIDQVRELRAKFPNMIYIGYSGLIEEMSAGRSISGSVAELFMQKMNESYDYLARSPWEIDGILERILAGKINRGEQK